ncbi:MAG: VOC family protein [Burkholderiaceae bacterium]|jgi:catechol 2,3-dioxygenase-like lactoylglutathione lyase family enzyme|nr:VOC family protein [Burkholderiaceae bacterium]
MKLAALRLFVRDLSAARSFYRDQLGLALTADGAAHGFLVFDLDGADLVVESVPVDAPAEDQALVGRFSGISFAVDDCAAAYARLSAAGVRFSGAPEAQGWGGVLATLRDADGNALQLVQYLAAGGA